MINEKTFLGYPNDFRGICYIYPPKISDMVNNSLGQYTGALVTSQEDIEDSYNENKIEGTPPTPFEYILVMAYANDRQLEEKIKDAFYFFIHEDVTFLYDQKCIVIGGTDEFQHIKSVEDLRIINEDNFFDFQNALREGMGQKPIAAPDPNEHPKIRAMKAKARYRDRIKAKRGDNLTLVSMISCACCMGIGLTPLNIGEISFAALLTLIQYYQAKDKYDIDIKALLAGGDSKKIKPVYWVKNIDN